MRLLTQKQRHLSCAVEQIAARLTDRFRLLTGGAAEHDAPRVATDDQRGHGEAQLVDQTGAHEVAGSILATWRARGAERSALGLPTGDEHAVDGGLAQDFEHGVLRATG